MKVFHKIFLCALTVLTLVLGSAEYLSVSSQMEHALAHQVESCLNEHQLVKYALQSGLMTSATGGIEKQKAISEIASEITTSMDVQLMISDENGELYRNIPAFSDLPQGDVTEISWKVSKEEDFLLANSVCALGDLSLSLTTARPIGDVFSEAETLREQSERIFFAETLAGALMLLAVAFQMTRPIKRLKEASAAMESGDYSQRVLVSSRDEIGELADTFNRMAGTIEENVGELGRALERQKAFTANFAHEIKTPMTSVIGYADTIAEGELSVPEMQEAAGYILNEGMRLEALSLKLMDLFGLDQRGIVMESIQTKDLEEDLMKKLAPRAEQRGVQLSLTFERAWISVESDLIETLVINLVENALKSGTSEVAVSGKMTEGRYVISVKDQGRGIPEDQIERVTEAFYMVDKARSRKEHGAGLGLALCQKIAELHGSNLRIESVEQVGTTVSVSVLLAEGEMDEETE